MVIIWWRHPNLPRTLTGIPTLVRELRTSAQNRRLSNTERVLVGLDLVPAPRTSHDRRIRYKSTPPKGATQPLAPGPARKQRNALRLYVAVMTLAPPAPRHTEICESLLLSSLQVLDLYQQRAVRRRPDHRVPR